MKKFIHLVINGLQWEGEVEVGQTLLELLRDDLGLEGAKQGCDGGECGACVVLLNGKAVQSCLILAAELEGANVTTIEGLNDDISKIIQEAYVAVGAVQCGFCAPGMVVATRALLDEHPEPDEEDINKALVGHLCRCTGYVRTVEAVQYAVKKIKALKQD
jgi:aerobic-type carbon monoxide dehydrogenase small subunit (CoxS/CutS family)